MEDFWKLSGLLRKPQLYVPSSYRWLLPFTLYGQNDMYIVWVLEVGQRLKNINIHYIFGSPDCKSNKWRQIIIQYYICKKLLFPVPYIQETNQLCKGFIASFLAWDLYVAPIFLIHIVYAVYKSDLRTLFALCAPTFFPSF